MICLQQLQQLNMTTPFIPYHEDNVVDIRKIVSYTCCWFVLFVVFQSGNYVFHYK